MTYRKENTMLKSDVGYARRLLVLLMIFFLALSSLGLLISLLPGMLDASTRIGMEITSALQDVVLFILPALIFAFIFSSRPLAMLGLDRGVALRSAAGVILLFIIMMPAMNQLVFWNEQVRFPAMLAALEQYFREMESAARTATDTLLSFTTFREFCIVLFLIGILAPVSEELFFRGALQRAIGSGRKTSPHCAIWISAFIFSAFHFQFYGFLPRMLLGAYFGYLFYWTGSIWVPILAHALNNSIVVIVTYISKVRPEISIPDDIGVTQTGIPWPAIVSALLFIIVITGLRRYLFSSSKLRRK